MCPHFVWDNASAAWSHCKWWRTTCSSAEADWWWRKGFEVCRWICSEETAKKGKDTKHSRNCQRHNAPIPQNAQETRLSYTREWVGLQNRGGLCEINDQTFMFFCELELIMRANLHNGKSSRCGPTGSSCKGYDREHKVAEFVGQCHQKYSWRETELAPFAAYCWLLYKNQRIFICK